MSESTHLLWMEKRRLEANIAYYLRKEGLSDEEEESLRKMKEILTKINEQIKE